MRKSGSFNCYIPEIHRDIISGTIIAVFQPAVLDTSTGACLHEDSGCGRQSRNNDGAEKAAAERRSRWISGI
jgi:hypothetical protein